MTDEELTRAMMEYRVKEAMKAFGLEGAEEVIRRVYGGNKDLRDRMLQVYNDIIHRKED
jgi:hypothetical protein